MAKPNNTAEERERLLSIKSEQYGSVFDLKANGSEERLEYGSVSIIKLYSHANCFDLMLMFIGSLCALLNGMIQPVGAIITGTIVNELLGEFTPETLMERAWPSIQAYIAAGIAVLIAAFIQASCWHTSCERQINRIRNCFFRAILRQNVACNMDRMREGMGDKFGVLIQSTAQFIMGFVIAFYYSWKMTLVMMAVMPFVTLAFWALARMMSTASRRESSTYSAAGAIAEEVLMNIRTVMAFNGQRREIKRYEEQLKFACKQGTRKAILSGASLGIFFALLFSSFGVAFWYGSTLISTGEMEPGGVFTVFMAVMSGSMAVGLIAPQLTLIITAKSAAAPVFDIISRVPSIDGYSSDGNRPSHIEGAIHFRGIHFAYPMRNDVKVLTNIDIDIKAGETVALVGHSGCGKSTLFALLERFYDPDRGSDVRELNLHWLRQAIGVVSQEPILFHLSVADNLRMGKPDITQEEMETVCRMANAHQFIKQLPKGYDTLIGEGGIQLSGGQKQRVAIARALARQPRILLLDEATSALDVESEGLVQQALELVKASMIKGNVQAAKGRTTMVIAHRLSTIMNADKIIVMQNGQIVQVGRHRQLLEDEGGVYRQLVDAQVVQDVETYDLSTPRKITANRLSVTTPKRVVSVVDQSELSHKRSSDSGSISQFTAMTRSEQLSRQISHRLSRLRSRPDDEHADRLKIELAEEGVRKAKWIEIAKNARKDWCLFIFAVAFSIIRGLMMPLFSLVFGQIFATFSIEDDAVMRASALRNSLFFVALGLIQGTSAFFCLALYGTSGERLTMRLRLNAFKNLLRQDCLYFDDPRHSSAKLTTRLATDAPNVKSAIDQRMASIIQSGIALISGLTIAFVEGWQVSLLTLGVFIILGGLQVLINRYVAIRDRRDVHQAEEAGKIAIESIENVRTVQALTQELILHNRFKKSMKKPHRSQLIKAQLQAISYSCASALSLFMSAGAYGFGIWLIGRRLMTPFRTFQVITSINMTTQGVMNAAAFLPEIMKARMAAGLMFAMIRARPKIDVQDETGLRNQIHGDLTARDVYFAYPSRTDRVILHGLSFETGKGKTLALVGASGCGKSTVVTLLNRFFDATDGRFEMDGVENKSFHLKTLRSQMATVGQEPILFNCSIRENIAYGFDAATEEQIERAAQIANIHDTIIQLPMGYNTLVGERGNQLSGGQKQRIAIARAIVREPKILLLDEATSALDSESEKLVQSALENAATGRTCITIAHRLSTVQNADCIAVIAGGRIVESGTPKQLISKKGVYYGMVMKQKLL